MWGQDPEFIIECIKMKVMCEKGKIDMIVGKIGQVGRVGDIVGKHICEVVDEMHEVVM